MEERIQKIIEEALTKIGAGGTSFTLERPAELVHGDYATNAAFAASKFLRTSPMKVAEQLAAALQLMLTGIATDVQIKIAQPGFINLTLSRDTVSAMIMEADAKRDDWGIGTAQAGKRVMVEYGNPNQFKEMHIGHLMSAIIGEALSRLVASTGAHVLRDTFGGDVGPHVAKALWALRKEGVTDVATAKEIGAAYVTGSNAYEDSAEAKGEIDAFNTKLYEIVKHQGEPENMSEEDRTILALWRKGRAVSQEEFMRIFSILGTKFDYEFYDSDTTAIGLEVVQDGLNKGIFEKSDGAIIYRGEKKGLHTLVFVTSRETPTYETKDIGLAFLKETRVQTDEIIVVTSIEQIGHFKVFLAALEDVAPLLAKKTKHVSHGLLRLTSGKMSSRKGNTITATELLGEIIARAGEKNEDPLIAEQVAVGAIKYMILRQAPGSDIIFDEEKSLSLEGDSGPYLQYALVRAQSVLAKASGDAKKKAASAPPTRLERIILHFPEVVARAARELAPNLLVNYLTELAGEWNSFYAQERIIGSEDEAHKLLTARAFVQTMQNGLALLGIPTPERM